MRELMVASTQYAFSEERMRDEMFLWMGVASTARRLFEDLVATYARACIALGDLESLFENPFRAHDMLASCPYTSTNSRHSYWNMTSAQSTRASHGG